MKITTIITITLSIIFSGCTDVNLNDNFKTKPDPNVTGRASLMYIIGDNDLNNFLFDDVVEMEYYFPKSADAKFFIFHDYRINGESYAKLYELNGNASEKISSPVLKEYGAVNACDTTVFNQVIQDIKYYYPNISLKNITLSSHGKGWVPDGAILVSPYATSQEPSYSFGVDYSGDNDEMDIHEMAECFEKYDFDVIIFDACHMATIEVFYELRNCAKQIIASPAEILADGFPYKNLADHYSTGVLDPEFIIEEFYDYYIDRYGGTITYVNTDKLELLAEMTKLLLKKYDYKTTYPTLVPLLSSYSRFYSSYIDDFYNLFELMGISDNDKIMFNKLWTECFPAYYKTDDLLGFDLTNTFGVAFYPPNPSNTDKHNEYFMKLNWAEASGFGEILK